MSEATPAQPPPPPPPPIRAEIGSFVVDVRGGARIGRVMAMEWDRLVLRPLGGGIEWSVERADLRAPTDTEMATIRAVTAPVSRTVL
ncbi:hypothetical protein [Streptomyces sp. NPDC048659]|uniref:hypothetical protein n=1 Tax=Streptomyces sp. NPDC048659 TaxID=3155489 RepID=UPI003441B4B9